MELSGAEASRPYIDAAQPEHPSLLDPEHRVDALFGVVNIPNVIWIDEDGVIVRPPEPGWPGERHMPPRPLGGPIPKIGRAHGSPPRPEGGLSQREVLASGQDRSSYADAIIDWVDKGSASVHALNPDEVVARSQPRPPSMSEGAAHFELANHLWRTGRRELAIEHFNVCHRLQPDNWTYKRQAWSLLGHERVGGDYGRFVQAPLEGEEDSWPFTSDFRSDIYQLGEGEYYPKTL